MRQTTICRQFVYILSTFCLIFVLVLSCFCPRFVTTKTKKIVICQDFPEKVLDLSDFCLEKFEKQKSWLSKKLSSSNDHIDQLGNIFEEKSVWQKYGL